VRPLTSQENPLFVTVRRDGVILLEETPVTLDELVEGLPQLLAGGTIDQVYIRADSLAPYGPVLRTIAAAASSGVRFALVAEPFRGR
jgi:biopolymer transport protein ExbD